MGRYTAMLRAGELVQIGGIGLYLLDPFLQEALRRFGRPDAAGGGPLATLANSWMVARG